MITQDQILDLFNKMSGAFFLVMIALSAVGLLVGGIGVMAVMMISVTESTREIGIRKAVGATATSIVLMILTESILITALAGYVGLIAGVGVVEAVAAAKLDLAFLRDPSVDIRVCLLASALLAAAGTLAGLFPALRAARVDPIVALREGT
jgi:putative ABC transport system permease protein